MRSESAWQSNTDFPAEIPAGTTIKVRTSERIDATSSNGRVFDAVVDKDVYDSNGDLVIPRGSDAQLIVRRAADNDLILDLDSVAINGQRYGVASTTAAVGQGERQGIGANERTGKFLGGGAILGAIIGGIAGGGKGAAIGAGAGAAAGAGAEVLTQGGKIDVPAESLLTFRLTQPLEAGIADQAYERDGQRYQRGYGNDAYERGLEEGRTDAEQGLPQNAHMDRMNGDRDRRDYEAGYNEGYQEYLNNADYGRQKPGYSSYAGSPWSIRVDPRDKMVRWQTPDNARIYVQVDNNPVQLFASGQSGSQAAPWIAAGHRYVFILQDLDGNEIARTVEDLR